jgi:hypothetical protein
MVPMSAPLDECTEHEIHPALAKADAIVRIDAQKAWAKLMQVGQQMEVANPAPVNRHWRWRKDTVISMLECEGAVEDHGNWLRQAGFDSPEEAITWLKEQPQVYVDSMRRLPDFRSHVCEDSTCECCLPLLTPVQVAERNLRGGNIFNEPPEEWERQCQKWRAVIAKENTKNDDSEFTQADERAMEAAMHDTLMAEEDSRRAFIRSQVAGPCLCPPNSATPICGPCQKWEEYCSWESDRREALDSITCNGDAGCACLACTEAADAARWDRLAEELRAKDARNEKP